MVDNLYFDTSEANSLNKNAKGTDPTIATGLNVKKGYLFKDASTREQLVGTMPINDSQDVVIHPTSTIHSENSYTIPEGYHDGTGKVSTGDLSDYTPGNALPEHVANNKIFWVNGQRLVGTLDLDENDQVGDATSIDIVEGKTAWVNREKIVGTVPRIPRVDQTLFAGESYVFPKGFSAGTTVISAASLAVQTPGNATEDQIHKDQVAWVNGQKVIGAYDLKDHMREAFAEADALQSSVLSGKKFYSSNYDVVVSGTMPDHTGEPPIHVGAGTTFNIPEGYYDGNSSIQVVGLEDITQGTATADEILYNQTAWVDGVQLTGTMPRIENTSVILVAGDEYDIPVGYHTGNGKVRAAGLESQTEGTARPEDIRDGEIAWVDGQRIIGTAAYMPPEFKEIHPGETVFIQKGFHSGAGTIWVKSLDEMTNATAQDLDILVGKTAWINGVEVSGAMANNPDVAEIIDAGETYTIPIGYHSGNSTITARSMSDLTPANSTSADILMGKTAWVNGEKVTGTLELSGSASSDDVVKGKTFYNVNAKTKVTGTLELTGNAEESCVLEGKTFYTNNPKRKLVGTMKLTGSVTPDKVLAGETYYDTNPNLKMTGTMTNIGSVTKMLAAGESYNIQEGYHSGTGVITSQDLTSQTIANAEAVDIVTGKSAWVNGEKINGTLQFIGTATPNNVASGVTFYSNNHRQILTGTMKSVEGVATTLRAGEVLNIEDGYHDGSGTVIAESLYNQTMADSLSSDIVEGKTAWVNGVKVTGTMPVHEESLYRVFTGNEIILPPGYYPNGLHVYCLYTDRLDLTGTDAFYAESDNSLNPNNAGYVDEPEEDLVITAPVIIGPDQT